MGEKRGYCSHQNRPTVLNVKNQSHSFDSVPYARLRQANKMAWFSYNQSDLPDELTLHPLQLDDYPSPEAEPVSPLTESLYLSPIEDRLVSPDGFDEQEGGGGGARKSGGGRKGMMGKGKSHRSARPQEEPPAETAGPEYRTHLLFQARASEGQEEPYDPRRSFMSQLFSGSWNKKPERNVDPSEMVQLKRPTPEPYYRQMPGLGVKQVSFLGDGSTARYAIDPRPDHLRRPNSYSSEATRDYSPYNEPYRDGSTPQRPPRTCDPYVNGTGPPRDRRGPPQRPADGPQRRGGPRQPPPGGREAEEYQRMMRASVGGPPDELSLTTISKDCFIIPQGNLERFLPDGIALPPREARRNPLLNILEVDDPKLAIVFHLMPPLSSLTPHLESPLSTPPTNLHRRLAEEASMAGQELQATEGFLLKNLEKDSEYPYINYFVIEQPRAEATSFFLRTRTKVYDIFDPQKVKYSCRQSIDLFDEVATIARPPVDALQSKKPMTDLTGYIVCIYRVFKGDDGEKFERNWLYWTGARMLYKNLPPAVGLRRITLHKTSATQDEVVYLLLVECTHFLDHINQAANLLPILRARICGYTGIYRCMRSF